MSRSPVWITDVGVQVSQFSMSAFSVVGRTKLPESGRDGLAEEAYGQSRLYDPLKEHRGLIPQAESRPSGDLAAGNARRSSTVLARPMTILDKIVATKRDEVARDRAARPLAEVRSQLCEAPAPRDFVAALRASGPGGAEDRASLGPMAVIAEVKKASPSAGIICEDFDPVAIANAYDAAGAACVSVLTDRDYFQGELKFLVDVRNAISRPVIRKDFLIDPYQVFEARAAGADCVLLIAECLDQATLKQLFELTYELGMHALIELYDESNVERVLSLEPPLVGVNNRDLRTFEVDIEHSSRLHSQMPDTVTFVSESGIRGGDETARLAAAGVDAVLVGETLMRAESISSKLSELALRD